MKIWILEPVKDWDPWFDKAFGFVVSAENEAQARQLAQEQCGDEPENAWLDPELTKCERLSCDVPMVVMRDFARA